MSLEAQELQIRMETPVYPLIKVEYLGEKGIKYSTFIRKKGEDDRYYLIKLIKEYQFFPDEKPSFEVTKFINLFHQDCYMFLIIGRVNINSSLLDTNQESEVDRLIKKFKL